LEEAPDHTLSLKEVYEWVLQHSQKAKNKDRGWQNSVRHNLSMNAVSTLLFPPTIHKPSTHLLTPSPGFPKSRRREERQSLAPDRRRSQTRRHFHHPLPQRSQTQNRTPLRHSRSETSRVRSQRRSSHPRCHSSASTTSQRPQRSTDSLPSFGTQPQRCRVRSSLSSLQLSLARNAVACSARFFAVLHGSGRAGYIPSSDVCCSDAADADAGHE
jgi:hypothetical protein